MTLCPICYLSQYINPGQQHHHDSSHSNLTAELEDSRRFSLNLLAVLLPILALSASKLLQPVVLVLLIYTISLRLATHACFHRHYPAVSKFLHAIPVLGTSCMAGVELVFRVQSPVVAIVGMLLGILPLLTIVIHHGRHNADASVGSGIEQA